MFDLKVINSVLEQLEQERGIPRERIIEAIEMALATAYKKEYGKKGQIVRAHFDLATGGAEFIQVKIVVDESRVRIVPEGEEEVAVDPSDERVRYNPEHHIMLEDARKIKKDAQLDDELLFPLENKGDYGRIAAQTAKQVIIQKIREAEKVSVMGEYGQREGEIVSGTVQRIDRGNIFIDLSRATGVLPHDEQIPGERYKQGERIRAYLYRVEETPRGLFLKLSRSHPQFLKRLFEIEAPEIANGTVEIKAVAREPGSRSKIAVSTNDEHIDPIGALVGQRGVRVSTVMSELNGEKIDIIEWSENTESFIEDALSPAKVQSVTLNQDNHIATVKVLADQQSLAIGKGGQNVRLAAKLTGWKIDIHSVDADGNPVADTKSPILKKEIETVESPATSEKESDVPAEEHSEKTSSNE